MAPPRCFIIGRVAARMRLNAPVRFTCSWRFQSSSLSRMTSWSMAMPALFTRTCSPPSSADDLLHRRGAGGRVGDVEPVELRLRRARLLHELERLRGGRLVARVVERHARAAARERDGDGAADAAGGAGDERGLALEVEGIAVSSHRASAASVFSSEARSSTFQVSTDRSMRFARPDEHLARPDLDEAGDALADELLDALDPAHRRGDLLDEERDDPRGVRVRAWPRRSSRPARDRRPPGDAAEHGLEPRLHRRHERAVEGGGHRERQHALRARLLEPRPGLLHGAGGARRSRSAPGSL